MLKSLWYFQNFDHRKGKGFIPTKWQIRIKELAIRQKRILWNFVIKPLGKDLPPKKKHFQDEILWKQKFPWIRTKINPSLIQWIGKPTDIFEILFTVRQGPLTYTFLLNELYRSQIRKYQKVSNETFTNENENEMPSVLISWLSRLPDCLENINH